MVHYTDITSLITIFRISNHYLLVITSERPVSLALFFFNGSIQFCMAQVVNLSLEATVINSAR